MIVRPSAKFCRSYSVNGVILESRIAPFTEPMMIHTSEMMNHANLRLLNRSAKVMVAKMISML